MSKQDFEDAISRQAVLEIQEKYAEHMGVTRFWKMCDDIKALPSIKPQEPKTRNYEKHIDHTDCIWYGRDSGCPVTCSQYRDGWNDAMDYIFKNGKGYQPYRHDG